MSRSCRIVFFAILISIPYLAHAQFPVLPNLVDENGKRTGHWAIWYDSGFMNIVRDPDSVVFYRLIKFEAGVPAGKIRDFTRSGSRYWDGYAKSIDPYVFDGESNHYHENGKLSFHQMYADGKREGKCAEYYPNGSKRSEGQFKDDMQEGTWTYFYEDGAKQVVVNFKEGVKSGPSTFYFKDGRIEEQGQYMDGLRVGNWVSHYEDSTRQQKTYKADTLNGTVTWFFANGKPEEKQNFVKGIKQGIGYIYHDNGQISQTGPYLDDQKHGKWLYYHTNGKLAKQGKVVHGVYEGVWEFFHENGKMSDIGMVKEGEYDGEWKAWYDDGTLKSSTYYVHDTLNGHYISYHPNGKVEMEGEKLDGMSTGLWKKYDEEGHLIRDANYLEDNFHGRVTLYYADGSTSLVADYKEGVSHGVSLDYHENGILKEEAYFVEGERDSVYRTFFEDGKPNTVGNFIIGKKEGEWNWYYPNGKLSGISTFKDGLEYGRMSSYYETGIKSVDAFRDGDLLQGYATFFYQNGNPSQAGTYKDNLYNGKWMVYDSASGRKLVEADYVMGKQHGLKYEFNESGKVTKKTHFVHGFAETPTSISDSLTYLIQIGDLKGAMEAGKWLQRVEKRDYKKAADRTISLRAFGRVYSGMQDFKTAIAYNTKYVEAVKKYQGENSSEYRVALHNLATSYHDNDDYEQALKFYEISLDAARKLGIQQGIWSTTYNKVACLYDAGREEEATALFEEELKQANTKYGPDSSATWYLRKDMAEYYRTRPKDYSMAIIMYFELLEDIEAANQPDHEYVFECNFEMGNILYNYLDKTKDAEEPYLKSMMYGDRHHYFDKPDYGENLVDLLYIQNAIGRKDSLSATIPVKLKKVLEVSRDASTRAEVNLAVGNELYWRRYYKEATQYFIASENDFRSAGKENTLRHANVLQSLAFSMYYSDRSKADQAEQYFVHSLDIRKAKAKRTSASYYPSAVQLANFYTNVDKYDLAIPLYNEAIEIATEVKDYEMLARAHQSLGELYYFKWQYNEALVHFEKAIAYYKEHAPGNESNWISTLSYILGCHKFLGDYDKAVTIGQEALTLSEKFFTKESSNYSYRLSDLASAYEANNLYTDALKYYTEAGATLSKVFGDTSTEYIGQQRNLIELYIKLNNFKKAVDLGEQMLLVIRKNYEEGNDTYLNMAAIVGTAYTKVNNYIKAEELLVSALNNSKILNGERTPATATHYLRLGKFYQNRKRYEESEQTFQIAVDIIRTSAYAKTSVGATYYNNLASVMLDQDKNKEAEELYTEAFNVTQSDTINNMTTFVSAGQELARFYSKVGRHKEAERLLIRVTNLIARDFGKKFYYAQTRENLILVYGKQKMYDEAEVESRALIAVLEDEVDPDHWLMLNIHNNLGIIYNESKQTEKARVEFQYCLDAILRKPNKTETDIQSLATYNSNVAGAEVVLGRYEDGYKHLMEADRLRRENKIVETQQIVNAYQYNLALYYKLVGRMDKAEETWNTLNQSLLTFSKNNFYFMSDEEKAQFWKTINTYFQVFQSFGAERVPKNPMITGNMYNVQLSTKAILLSASNKIRKRILSSRDTIMVNMYYRWTNKREQLAQLYTSNAKRTSIDSLEIAVKLLEKEMNISAEDLSTDKGGESVTWKQVQGALTPNEAAVEIIRFRHYDKAATDSIVYAALVLTSETKTAPKFVILGDGRMLEGRYLKYYRNSIATKNIDSISYVQYWSPLAAALAGKSRVYLSLDGVYNQINLNTLMDAKGRYLVEDKNLTLLSNTKDVLAIKSRKLKRVSLAAATLLGFPTYFLGRDKVKSTPGVTREFDAASMDRDATGIAPLFGTEEEIKKIGSILTSHKMQTDIYTNAEASEHQIKQLQHPRILHIATHGFFVEEQGSSLGGALGTEGNNPLLRAGLLLAGASNFIQNRQRVGEENGILTAYEAANLNLDNTDLVVLSACETGKGEVQNGEGVYGLQRAFQTAGARTIIMSLWKVDDAATQQLMTTFYSNWMDGMSKAEALKSAQVSLKKQYPHPYYWGAFVMLEN